MAMGPDQTIYVADVLNWSVGWTSKQTEIPFK